MNDQSGATATLAAARRAYDDGDLETCLRLVEEQPSADAAALALLAWTELGRFDRAHERSAAAERAGERSLDLDFARAQLALREWRLDDARAGFERVLADGPDPVVLGRLALLDDLAGDFAAADARLAGAGALDPDGFPPPPRLAPEEFHDLVDAAARSLPAEFQRALADIRVVLDPMPTIELIDPTDPAETPPDLLGLFVGASDLERGTSDPGFELPPAIYLFQRNLERAVPDRETLAREIGVTLWHELAHKLGFDEDGVDELGLG